MAATKARLEYHEESAGEKLARKSKDAPFMVVGLVGLVTACSIGAYKFRTKGSMSTSVFLMQLRVAAQGSVVAALTGGLAYTLFKEYFYKEKTQQS